MDRHFSTLDLSKRSHVTLRQLQYWDELGIVPASRKRKRFAWPERSYSFDQAIAVGFIHRLRTCGLGIRKIRQALRVSANSQYVVVESPTGKTHAAKTREEVLHLFDEMAVSAVLIDLEEIREKLR